MHRCVHIVWGTTGPVRVAAADNILSPETQFFEPGKMPARTCVGVMALPLNADVEIECIAEIL